MANDSVRTALLLVTVLSTHVTWADQEPPSTPEHVIGEQAYPFDSNDPRDVDKPPIELPDSVAPKLGLLTPEEIEF